MSDKTFEWSLAGLTALIVAWIVLGIVFQVLAAVAVIIIGTIAGIGFSGYLLYVWGKSCLERTEGM